MIIFKEPQYLKLWKHRFLKNRLKLRAFSRDQYFIIVLNLQWFNQQFQDITSRSWAFVAFLVLFHKKNKEKFKKLFRYITVTAHPFTN